MKKKAERGENAENEEGIRKSRIELVFTYARVMSPDIPTRAHSGPPWETHTWAVSPSASRLFPIYFTFFYKEIDISLLVLPKINFFFIWKTIFSTNRNFPLEEMEELFFKLFWIKIYL